jgi:hypothetical protein
MTIKDRFLSYAAAFEESYRDNDWSRLTEYFTEDAVYDSGMDEPAEGRDAVLAKLEAAVDGLDRLMDSRTLEIRNAESRGDTVSIQWTVHFRKAGLPALTVDGAEFARFEGDRIAHLRDEVTADALGSFQDWLSAHGDQLFS